MLKGKVFINEQETGGNYKFAGIPHYMTSGFQNAFGKDAVAVAFTAFALILEKYPDNADYLQTFKYVGEDGKEISFWCINDVEHATFLLPEDY